MPDTHDHVLFEGNRYGFDLIARINFSDVAASGDGWNEPHEPAHVQIEDVVMFKRIRGRRAVAFGSHEAVDFTEDQVVAEATPQWVYELLAEQEWDEHLPCPAEPEYERD